MDWKQIISTVAPWIGTALGGPLGGMAVTAAASALGLSDKTTDALKNAISGATPEQMLALKNADNDFAIKMQALGFQHVEDMEKLFVGDRDSARKREMAVQDKTNRNLAYIVVGAFLALVGSTILGYAKVDSVLAGTLVGYLSAKCEQVLAYYFGSSKSSDRKTELLAQSPAVDGS
jgi:hypothetical protein